MTMRMTTLTAVLSTIFMLSIAAGTAVAGDGKSCGDKQKDSAATVVPAQPQA